MTKAGNVFRGIFPLVGRHNVIGISTVLVVRGDPAVASVCPAHVQHGRKWGREW